MMRSSILGASTMLNVLIQHLPLQSLFWTKIWRAFRALDPSRKKAETGSDSVDKPPCLQVFRVLSSSMLT